MEETRPKDGTQIFRISSEEKFFLLIEKRYYEQGFELLETCGSVQCAQRI